MPALSSSVLMTNTHSAKAHAIACALSLHHSQMVYLANDGAPLLAWGVCAKFWAMSADGVHVDFYQSIDGDIHTSRADYHDICAFIQDYQTRQSCHLFGFIGYDISAHALSGTPLPINKVLLYFAQYDQVLAYDGAWRYNGADVDIHNFNINGLDIFSNNPKKQTLSLQAQSDYADYVQAFTQVQDYLHAGDAYQINLTQNWRGQGDDLRAFLPQLPPAPWAGYLCDNALDFEILSASPELFLSFDNKHATAKPIKGTMPRHPDPVIDNKLRTTLQNSAKDRGENLMIVDLLRNDLGKHAQIGSVRVPVLFGIESYNVHHMVSTITATLHNPALTVLFDSLPAGSITGAPKKRAVQIIHQIEGRERGAYCGTLGYLHGESGAFNVLIRTLERQGFDINLSAGGGITVLSDCQSEYDECLHKIAHLQTLLGNI